MQRKPAMERVAQAKRRLMMDSPFFGSLLGRIEDRECNASWNNTAATNGKVHVWNRSYVDSLSAATLLGVKAHETLHDAGGHHVRRGGRDPKGWNIATDLRINADLKALGFELPKGALFDSSIPPDWTPERIYAERNRKLQDPEPGPGEPDKDSGPEDAQEDGSSGEDAQEDGSSGEDAQEEGSSGEDAQEDGSSGEDAQEDGSSGEDAQEDGSSGEDAQEDATPSGSPGFDPGACGQVIDADLGPIEAEAEAADAAQRVCIAANAERRERGSLPPAIERLVGEIKSPPQDWRERLRQWFSRSAAKRYQWTRPNRKHIASGRYFPARVPDAINHFIAVLDTSGSIDANAFAAFRNQVADMLEQRIVDRITFVHADDSVRFVESFESGDSIADLKPRGGNGTDFAPAFDWIAENAEDAAGIVFFTDLDSYSFGTEPDLPLLWIVWGPLRNAPFGEVLDLDPHS